MRQPGYLNVLIRARDLIQTRGWIRGELSNKHGYCMLGALKKVVETPREGEYVGHLRKANRKAEEKLLKLLTLGHPFGISVSYWNDNVAKDKKQVLALFDKAISGGK